MHSHLLVCTYVVYQYIFSISSGNSPVPDNETAQNPLDNLHILGLSQTPIDPVLIFFPHTKSTRKASVKHSCFPSSSINISVYS